ncbi:MAG: type II toxin-antitoxin system Phd/YefM family antitoxin [Egibacteraceae bacterium]
MTEGQMMVESLSVAEAKRRFSELIERVGRGERFIVCRRGKPTVALVAPDRLLAEAPRDPPLGLAAFAGALAEWDDQDAFVEELSQLRRAAVDRPAPDLG